MGDNRMKWWLEILGDALIIAFSGTMMFISVILPIQLDGYQGQEPNLFILCAEIIMSLLFMLIGINRWLGDKGESCWEQIGDGILIISGLVLLGIFLTILYKGTLEVLPVKFDSLVLKIAILSAIMIFGVKRLMGDIYN